MYVCKIYKGYGCSTSRYRCNNPKFTRADHCGYDTHLDLLSIINNKIDVIIQRCVTKHGTQEYMCKEVSYCLRSRQQPVKNDICLVRACQGSTKFVCKGINLDTHIINTSLMRPGCIDQLLCIPTPDYDNCLEILQKSVD